MPDPSLAILIRPLLGFAKTVLPYAKRLHAERSAATNPFAKPLGISPFEKDLDQTLVRLGAMGDADNRAWWQDLLTSFEQSVVQPDLFQVAAVEEWLSLDEVRKDLKALARAHIHGSEIPPAAKDRLVRAYMQATGEAEHLALDHIEIAVTVMVAGAVAPLNHGDRLLLDNLQGLHQKLDDVAKRLPQGPGTQLFDAAAKDDLTRIKKRRFIPSIDARAEVRVLVGRVENGDLGQASVQVCAEVLRWAARLHAVHKDTLIEAQEFLDRAEALHQGPVEDVAIIKAWIQFEQGALDAAIQSLRPFDTPVTRSTKLSMLAEAKGNRAALEWAEGLNRSDPKLFSPVGWRQYAGLLHEESRWDEAIAALELLGASDWDECPDIPYVLGLLHLAQLLPEPLRHYVLDGNGSLIGKHLIEGQEADQHRDRAVDAFQRARELLRDLKAQGRIDGCDYWLMWLALSSQGTRDQAAQQLQAKIGAGDDDLQFIDLAVTYGVPFEWREVARRFRHRELEGGLTDREEAARFTLLRHHAPVEQFLEYLDENEARLTRFIANASVTGIKLEKLIKAKRLDEAERLLDDNPSLNDVPDLATARMAIADARGQDVSAEALRIYQAAVEKPGGADVLQALHNVVTALLGNDRRHDAIPHLKSLFRLERTSQILDFLADCLQHTAGYAAVLAELDANPDLLTPDTRYGRGLLERKAEAMCRLGRFREARTVNDLLLERDSRRASLIHRDVLIALRSGDWERFPAIVERHFEDRNHLEVTVLLQLAHAAGDRDSSIDRAMELLREAVNRAPDDANVQISCFSLACALGREDEAGAWLQRAIKLSGDDNGPIRNFSLEQVVEMARHHADERDEKHRRFFSGEIPLHMSALEFNVPLSRLLISIPRANARQTDGRNTLPVGIRSGIRAPEPPRPDATLAMDVTTLLLLQELGLLDTVWNAAGSVMVSPRIMDFLFREIRQLPYHQPSRVERARILLGHVDAKRIAVIEPGAVDPRHEAEFGEEIACLVAAARHLGGRVVALAQIHKAGSLNQEPADWGDAAPLVLSTRQLAEGMRRLGHLERDACDTALAHLTGVDTAQSPGPDLSGEVPLFIDDLALTYLTDAGLLNILVHRPLSLFVHRATIDMARQLVASDAEGQEAIPTLTSLRRALAEYYRQGRLSFFPEAPSMEEDDDDRADHDDRLLMLRDLMHDFGSVDAVVIDDRWIGRHRQLTDRDGKPVPLQGVVDLVGLPAVDESARRKALHHLWLCGFGFLPLDQEEVHKAVLDSLWLEETKHFHESAELRAIRQTICRLRSIKMARLGDELAWFNHLAMVGGLTVHRLWDDETISEARARALSDWLVDSLIPWPLDWQDSIAEGHWIDLELAMAGCLYPLIIVRPHHASRERKRAYGRWLDDKLIQSLLGTAPRVVELVAESLAGQLAGMIAEIDDELEG